MSTKSDIKPTPARLRAVQSACEAWLPWGYRDARCAGQLLKVRLIEAVPGEKGHYRATDAGRAWLAQHDKEANRG